MEIDVEKVAEVALGFEHSSEAIGAVAGEIAKLAFDGDTAGRNYGELGARIALRYDGVEASFRRWSEASEDNAVALRASVAGYQGSDGYTASFMADQGGRR